MTGARVDRRVVERRLAHLLEHQYFEVDLAEVHRVLTRNLGDFEEFAHYIHAYLANNESPARPLS